MADSAGAPRSGTTTPGSLDAEGAAPAPARSRLDAMLKFNAKFVARGAGAEFAVEGYIPTRCVVLTCMDSRLTHL